MSLTAAFGAGLLIGSFLNVVIHRIPLGASIVYPGSTCPTCEAPIAIRDNIPLASFVFLRGRCRACRQRISLRYPAIEFVIAILFTAIVWFHGLTWQSLGEMWFVSVILALAVIDATHHLLPDRITYPSLVVAIVAAISRNPLHAEIDQYISSDAAQIGFSRWRTALIGAVLILTASVALWLLDQIDLWLFSKYDDLTADDTGTPEQSGDRRSARVVRLTVIVGFLFATAWFLLVLIDSPRNPEFYQYALERMLDAGFGAMIGGLALWVVRAAYFLARGIEGMGLGDAKLMAVIGAVLGWPGAILSLFCASLMGLILGLLLARKSGMGLQTRLPLGFCIGLAAIVILLLVDAGFYSLL